MTPKQFFSKIQLPVRLHKKRGLFSSVVMAQAFEESGSGNSLLTKKYNAAFGIKAGSSWKGKTVNMCNKAGTDCGTYRVYRNLNDSIKDRQKLIGRAKWYSSVKKARTPEEQAELIAASGYAGRNNPAYGERLKAHIKKYNLKQYDRPIIIDIAAGIVVLFLVYIIFVKIIKK